MLNQAAVSDVEAKILLFCLLRVLWLVWSQALPWPSGLGLAAL